MTIAEKELVPSLKKPARAACSLPLSAAQAARQRRRLVLAMVLSVALISALALWDQAGEADASLHDFTQEQVSLARVAAGSLALHLRAQTEASLHGPLDFSTWVPAQTDFSGAPAETLLLPPGAPGLVRVDGTRVASTALKSAMQRGERWARIERPEAARLGLPERTAIAGIAQVADAQGAPWRIAIVASAARVRDRGYRATWRFLLSVGFAVLVVAAFGSAALRTQRKQFKLERALSDAALEQRQSEQLARENRAATMLTLAAGVAHEVSTPLSVIAGRAEQLLSRNDARELDEARVTRAAHTIVEQTRRIREVVHGFLRLARGKTPVLEQVRPYFIVQTASELVEHRFLKAQVALRWQAEPTLTPIRGDALLLQNALVNLLINACEACEPGGLVELCAVAQAGRLRFTVDDDGSGISEAAAARVMEPFFSTKHDSQGTGVGLAIAKEIVALHRGSLTLEPKQPRGSRAVISLPTEDEDHDTEAGDTLEGQARPRVGRG